MRGLFVAVENNHLSWMPVPKVLSFQEAIDATDGKDRALLLGNGFSNQYFNYPNLLEKSGLQEGQPIRKLFEALNTVDFEKVVRALDDAAIVERAYDRTDHADELSTDAQRVREALVKAIKETHPANRADLAYQSSAEFLANFNTVFSLNYDLLLYWVNFEKELLRDGFGFGKRAGAFHGPFSEAADCNMFNVHGGLHLFLNGQGELMKALNTNDGVIATITNAIEHGRRLPLYVAEGTSTAKMRKINSVAYLRHCYDKLRENEAAMFVYGHSASDNDAHIYRAIFSQAKHVFFGVYKPDDEKLLLLNGRLAKYRESSGADVKYEFYDSESATVWG
jgi:hypothetical protein